MTARPRVAVLGNMNNNGHNLVRFLRREGVDAHLLFFANEAGHFVPSADSDGQADYPSRTLSWGGYGQLLTTPAATIREDLREFPFLIGSRLAPAYAQKAGRRLDIFMPSGGDLHMLPMFSGWAPKDLFKFLIYSRAQRRGIQASRTLFWDATNPELEEKIRPVVQGMDRISHAIPMLYYPDFEGEAFARRRAASSMPQTMAELRGDADILLLHHVKHVWKPATIRHYGLFHDKANDELVRGLARYYAGNPAKQVRLVMVRFGTDYDDTAALAEELGVAEHIAWLPQMPRKELMIAIGEADAVVGEVARSWFSYGTIFEAMVMKKAVLHHRDDALYPDKELYPMLSIHDGESFAHQLDRVARGEVDLVGMGEASHRWLMDYGFGGGIREILARIDQAST